ncbi:leucine-rich repeat protein 1-like [Diadema antillarum]|uniref:leucine-rich repeat protein 1-like n=1 Tax=Diadema antillarum TaxID=105358 RepID=UPI003A85E872
MRLPCDVEIQNRMLPSHGMAKRGRTTRASLVIGRRPMTSNKEGSIFLAVCTAKDRDGAKYSLKGNVEKIFARFAQEGKATLRLQEPAQDVCISKADPLQLKAFLTAVNMAHRDKSIPNVQLSSLVPAKQSQVERPKTSVVVRCPRDYPITTSFPKTMENLQVNDCRLKKVDSRILLAKHLRSLDLSSNIIHTLPDTLNQLPHLSEINFSHNQLQHFPVSLCQGHLMRTLQYVNVSHNYLKGLPHQITNLASLVRLDVSHNDMGSLPENFGRLRQLRFLNASHNRLSFVPFSFMELRMDEIDLSRNEFDANATQMCIFRTTEHCGPVPSLLELVGRTIVTKKLPFQEGEIPVTLCFYLSPSQWHWCYHGSPISIEREPHGTFSKPLDLSRVAHSVTSSDFGRRSSLVPMRGYLCSRDCQLDFMKNSRYI